MKRTIILLILFAFFSSCSDFEEINKDIYGVTDEAYKAGGLAYGAPIMKMQQLIIPIGTPAQRTGPGNALQNTDLISSGNYIGYFGNNNNWGFNIESNWNFPQNRMQYAYRNFYSNLFREWQEINLLTKDSKDPFDKQVMAIANIMKVTGWLRATDVFGPITYSNAGQGDIAPKLDSQKEVYRLMLEDLDKSAQTLKDVSYKLLDSYDIIYDGNTNKWVKFANSLMLRIAVRSHFQDKAMAQKYIEKALDPSNGGVIETIDDEAKVMSSSKLPLLNPMMASVEEYDETRMGATIWGYLNGYEDPRMGAYFTEGNHRYYGSGYYAVAPANKRSKQTNVNFSEISASKPKINSNTPIYWFRASETYFLKAEAALYRLTGGDAQSFYEKGVRTSFEENSVAGVEDYLQKDNLPSGYNYTNSKYAWTYYEYSYNLENNNVSPNWDSAASDEEKLQKIITQKYLALYPNAVEAWTEYRRTGYPFLMPPYDEGARNRIGCPECFTPERFIYPATEYNNNPNMSEIPSLLNGPDTGATKLWWVRNDRPKQK